MVDIRLFNEDCITGMQDRLEPESVDLTVTSIPFEELFQYSGKLEDVGNNGSTVNLREGRFALNMRFVVENLFRIHKPGSNCCIHIQQLLSYANQHGYIGRRDFNGAVRDWFQLGGFKFFGEFVISKNPQAIAQRLKLHSLQFKTGKSNAANLAPVFNDYVLIFKKPGETANPVRALYDKTENPNGWVSTEEWIKWASGVWGDINEIDILDGHRSARESDEEKHVCPLQLTVIRRLIRLYTNPISIQPDVCVFDPFGGIMSVPYVAVEQNRNAKAFELKESYFAQGERNIELVKKMMAQKNHGLFDSQEIREAVAA